MLAKKIKIHNLIWQRNFITKQLEAPRKDGDPLYRYKGYIYPENIKYFTDEGYEVNTISNQEEGYKLYAFVPSDDINLTPEEELTSKNIATDLMNISEKFKEDLSAEMQDFLGDLLFGTSDSEDEFHDANEESL